MTAGPSLKYPGAKWRLAPWIVGQLPPARAYVEPFFGSGAVLLSKSRSDSEHAGDLSEEVVNLFSVMQRDAERLARAIDLTPYARGEFEASFEEVTEPFERARRTLVRHWMSVAASGAAQTRTGWRHSGVAAGGSVSCPREWQGLPDRIRAHGERLQGVRLERRPALELLREVNDPETLAYVDPPYLGGLRDARLYAHEMTGHDEHRELLEFLRDEWRGPVVLSGYAHPLYDDTLHGWERREREAMAARGGVRTEVLWLRGGAGGLFA